jgi:hypothetical protein
LEGGSIMVKKQTAVVFIDSNKLYFWAKGLKNNFQMDIPSDTVSDLDVINREKLEQLVDTFFQTNSIKGLAYEAMLVFSQNTTFEKDFADDNTKVKHEEIQKFLDMVPFEDVASNIYTINRKTKVIALNKALYDAISGALQKNKVAISLVIPMAVLVETNAELTNNLDLAFIAARIDSFRQYSLIDVNKSVLESEQKNSIGIKRKDVRLFALVGFFIVLFLVLIFMIFTTFFSKPTINNQTVVSPRVSIAPTPKNETNSLATPSGNISSPSSTLESTSSSKMQ